MRLKQYHLSSPQSHMSTVSLYVFNWRDLGEGFSGQVHCCIEQFNNQRLSDLEKLWMVISSYRSVFSESAKICRFCS